MEYVNAMEEEDLDIVSEFLVMTATASGYQVQTSDFLLRRMKMATRLTQEKN